MLWEKEVLGREMPKALQRCVFYHIEKKLLLEGRKEQRGLKCSGLIQKRDLDQYAYLDPSHSEYCILIG